MNAALLGIVSAVEFAGLPAGQSEILVDGLPRLLRELEPDQATGDVRSWPAPNCGHVRCHGSCWG
jgi:hypothetical protein